MEVTFITRFIWGQFYRYLEEARQEQSELALAHILAKCPERQRTNALRILQLFLSAIEQEKSE